MNNQQSKPKDAIPGVNFIANGGGAPLFIGNGDGEGEVPGLKPATPHAQPASE